jgi:eukaryotic-like serine/threonine-protein kinase
MEGETMSPTALQLHDDSEFYVSVGDLIAGKYRVERLLGAGGMAFVLSARHVELDQHFALKFLAKRFLGNAMIAERFTQEAKSACKIRSEHVARVYDVGTHLGAPFFVMEHLEGRDLSAVVRDSGALRVDDAVEYVMQACEALAVAHCHGIVHRDIKPENLFLVEREGLPIIKVLDFGISKAALSGSDPPSRLTGELTLGTPCYMSPEQIRSTASADARSDQWSLGVVLYELLAGTEAFRAESVNAVCAAVLEREPPPLEGLRPELPQGLAEVVTRCLAKDCGERFADVAELAAALLPFAPTRALVSAERSSSVMRGARRDQTTEQRISAVRSSSRTSSTSSSSRSPSSSGAGGVSSAPVARSIAVAAARPARRMPTAWIAAALGVVATVSVVAAFGTAANGEHPGYVAAAPIVAAPPPEAVEPAIAPAAMRRAPAAHEVTPESTAAATVAVAASPVDGAAGPKRGAAQPARDPAVAVTSASSPAPSLEGTPGRPAASSPAPHAAPSAIELGY